MRKPLFMITLISLFAVTACRDGNEPDIPPLPGDDQLKLTGTLKGRIFWEGAVPPAKPIPTSADPACKDPGLVSEEYVVSDGGLENVIVYVSSGLEGKSFTTPKAVITLDQTGCRYTPHALTIQTNQPLLIANNDEAAHNIHAWAEVNSSFNESQATKGQITTKTFAREEVMLPIRCDVHNWMSAFIGIFSHPAHTVSKQGGAYEMKLPAGKYTITAQHETLGKQQVVMEIADNATLDLDFTFKAK